MFRSTSRGVLAIILSSVASAMPLPAQDTGSVASYERSLAVNPSGSLKKLADGILAKDTDHSFMVPPLAAVAGVGLAYATSQDPSIVFLVSVGSSDRARWSQAAWLSIMDYLAGLSSLELPTGVLMLASDESVALPKAAPGDPLFRGTNVQEALSDIGITALLVVDMEGPPDSISFVAASSKRHSPLRVLEAARRAALDTGTVYNENPVADFYVAAGLRTGNAALAPWLKAGLPAIALQAASTAGVSAESGLGAFSLSFIEQISMTGTSDSASGQRKDDDVNYFRYPLPSGMLTIGDKAIVVSSLSMSIILGVFLSTGLLTRQRRRNRSKWSVLRESFSSLALSVTAFAGAALLSAAALAMLTFLLGDRLSAAGQDFRLIDAILVLLRLSGALSCYYAVSGASAKLGLHGDYGRIEAMQAALILFILEALIALWFIPSAMPFLLLAINLLVFTAGNAAASALGLLLVGLVAFPFADPRVFIDLGGLGGVRGTLMVSIFAAPVGLWIGVASSSVHYMRRGRSTFGLWTFGAAGFALAEAALRLASGSG